MEDPRGSGWIFCSGCLTVGIVGIVNQVCRAEYFDTVGVIQRCVSMDVGEGPTGIWAMLWGFTAWPVSPDSSAEEQ